MPTRFGHGYQSSGSNLAPVLHGRESEIEAVTRLLDSARDGVSGALVIRGEPGIGKTALLDEIASRGDMPVLRGLGIESEAELPFSSLHLLFHPVLAEHLPALPEPQRQALEGAFGLAAGPPADRMLVGLAVLTLLSCIAERTPVLCIIDDAQWLDRPSAEALLFAARRLGAEDVVMLFGVRTGDVPFPAPGLPDLHLTGLSVEAAAALVDEHDGDLAPEVRGRVLAEAGGNPLALMELPAALRTADTTGVLPLTSRLQLAFHAQALRLSVPTRALLLVAAADDTGDLAVVLRAAADLGADVEHLAPAEQAGLIHMTGQHLAFRHPLVRAAVYQGAPLDQRLRAHRALATAVAEPDRRAWHLASAATSPDAHVAAELARTAALALTRKGYAAAAAAYERASQLAEDADQRTLLLAGAAEAAMEAGQLTRAQTLAERALPRVQLPSTRLTLVRVLATAAVSRGDLHEAHALLLAEAARRAEDDPREAVAVMVEVLQTTWFANDSRLATADSAQLDRLRLPEDDPAWPVLTLQRWLTALTLDRATERPPDLPKVIARAAESRADEVRDLLITSGVALMGGLDQQALELATLVSAEARAQGRVGVLPSALYYATAAQTFLGRYRDAMATAAEALDIAETTGQDHWASVAAGTQAYLLAIRGDEDSCRRLASQALEHAGGAHRATWALGMLELGYGRAQEALDQLMTLYHDNAQHLLPVERSLPDLVEAAVRLGDHDLAAEALARFEPLARRAPEPAIEAVVHRCRALLTPGDDAFHRALTIHERDSRGFEHARTRLLYGEWLRRARRKAEAREQLAAALETFDDIGARPWADRAHSELVAGGAATTTRRDPGVLALLTPQELQVVTLAAQGLSNRDIAAQMFLSPRTVGHHLYRAYPKLGVASRGELAAVVQKSS